MHAGLRIAHRHRAGGVAVIALVKATNFLRERRPRFSQNCTAIFMATSTATEPDSEKNTRSRSPGRHAASRVASVSACSCTSPPSITCGIDLSWRSTASRILGWL